MPIESFYEMLVIDTPEKAKRLVEAFEAAERRGPYTPKHDVMRELEEGKKIMKEYFEKCRAEEERSGPQ
ncbi:MAG: hypothetical protein FWC29_03790 [Methanomassiliicoccaceae archaeon]|nr:hypothetical protein [Methanomassiliicoccaceae archaeon]